MFCCGCLNTEAKLRSLDENLSRALREFLGHKVSDRYLYEYICWTCYVRFMKSIKFKEQCIKARNMVFGMVNVSRESLNTSHMLNFKPNLTQSKIVLTDVGPALETDEDSFFPIIQEIKSEVPDEGTITDVNETICDVKINFTENNKLSNEYVVEDSKEFTQGDGIDPGTIPFMTDKELKEEIVVKEECSYSSQEESVDIAHVETGTPSDADTPLKKVEESKMPSIVEGTDTSIPAKKRTFNEIPQKAKRIKLHETTMDIYLKAYADLNTLPKNNCRPLGGSFSKHLSADSNEYVSKSKQIIKSTANYYELNKVSTQANNLLKEKIRNINVLVKDDKTLTSKVCYSNVKNETFMQCLPNKIDAVAPNTSLVRYDEKSNTNVSNKNMSENELSCHICQYKCVTKSHLNTHLRKHPGEKPYTCDLCGDKFSRNHDLNMHIKYKHTKEKNFSCHMCQYKCVTKKSLNIHLRKHTGEKPYKCNLCDNKFSRKNDLNMHTKYKHTKEKKFSCHVCQYKCVTKNSLIMHLRKHTGEKPYTCDSCNGKFSRKNDLNMHIKYKHTKERNFSCHMCHYRCVTKISLNIHLRKHTGEKPYNCDLCDDKFLRKSDLNVHLKYKHTKERNFSCHMCHYKCVTKNSLNIHLRKHTGEKPYTCDLCGYKSSVRHTLINHIKYKHTKEKNFSCHMCHYKGFTKGQLNLHLRRHIGEKPYICNLCDYKCLENSKLKYHIKRKHIVEIPYVCDLCDSGYCRKDELIKHINDKHAT